MNARNNVQKGSILTLKYGVIILTYMQKLQIPLLIKNIKDPLKENLLLIIKDIVLILISNLIGPCL